MNAMKINVIQYSGLYDLRTPLTSITGCLSILQEDRSRLDEAVRVDLIANAYQEANRLNRMIGNLLDITRIASGALSVQKSMEYVSQVICFALGQFDDVLRERDINIEAPATALLASLDFELMVRALANVIENAIECSPDNSTIQVQINCTESTVNIRVTNNGAGLSEAEVQHIFDKADYTQGGHSGQGLGLAVSRGILEAHEGSMQIENRPGGESVVTLTLPL
jgi:two-component system, OmpR family, sensor histidine kinase KdpD